MDPSSHISVIERLVASCSHVADQIDKMRAPTQAVSFPLDGIASESRMLAQNLDKLKSINKQNLNSTPRDSLLDQFLDSLFSVCESTLDEVNQEIENFAKNSSLFKKAKLTLKMRKIQELLAPLRDQQEVLDFLISVLLQDSTTERAKLLQNNQAALQKIKYEEVALQRRRSTLAPPKQAEIPDSESIMDGITRKLAGMKLLGKEAPEEDEGALLRGLGQVTRVAGAPAAAVSKSGRQVGATKKKRRSSRTPTLSFSISRATSIFVHDAPKTPVAPAYQTKVPKNPTSPLSPQAPTGADPIVHHDAAKTTMEQPQPLELATHESINLQPSAVSVPDNLVSTTVSATGPAIVQPERSSSHDSCDDPFHPTLENLIQQNPLADLTGHMTLNPGIPVAFGGFASVQKGTWQGKIVAVKILKPRKNPQSPANWEQGMNRRLNRESIVWAALKHPNIVELYGCVTDIAQFPSMVSHWCQNGNASEYLEKNQISRHQRFMLAENVVDGLSYIHSLHVVHGDLKPKNVLINDAGIAQICDFGLVRLTEWQGAPGLTTTSPYGGTERYKAHELFPSKTNKKPKPTSASDVFALACVIYEFVLSNVPWSEVDDFIFILEAIRNNELPATRPSDLSNQDDIQFWDLIESCWNPDPKKRPVVDEVGIQLRNCDHENGLAC